MKSSHNEIESTKPKSLLNVPLYKQYFNDWRHCERYIISDKSKGFIFAI